LVGRVPFSSGNDTCVAANDQVAKPEPAIDAARRAPKGEVRIYPGVDHFDIYDGPSHEAVVTDEIEFHPQ
jgi:hypothetical protein